MIIKLNERQKSKLNKNQFCIVSDYFNQYASGLSGITTSQRVILKSLTQGFNTEEEALNEMKNLGLEPYRLIEGGKDDGYGSVGRIEQKVKIYTIGYALVNFSEYSYEGCK